MRVIECFLCQNYKKRLNLSALLHSKKVSSLTRKNRIKLLLETFSELVRMSKISNQFEVKYRPTCANIKLRCKTKLLTLKQLSNEIVNIETIAFKEILTLP